MLQLLFLITNVLFEFLTYTSESVTILFIPCKSADPDGTASSDVVIDVKFTLSENRLGKYRSSHTFIIIVPYYANSPLSHRHNLYYFI